QRVGQNLGEGGVIPGRAQQVEDGGLHGQRTAETVDEFAGLRTDDFRAEDAAGLGRGDHLHVAAGLVHEDRLAVVVERIRGDEMRRAGLGEFVFLPANAREGRIGEDDGEQQVGIDGLELFAGGRRGEGVARGEFALRDGEVHDVVRAADIAAGIDVRDGGLLPAVGGDPAGPGGLDARGGEIEVVDVGLAAERVEQMVGAADDTLAGAPEGDGDAAFGVGGDLLDFGVGVQVDALVAESGLDDRGGLGGVFLEDVRAALDLDDARADAAEKLGELAGDDAAAEHDHALGREIEVEHVVAGPVRGFGEAGHGRHADARAGGDEYLFGGYGGAVVELDGARIEELRLAAYDGVAVGRHGLLAVAGEVGDHVFFPAVQGLHVHVGLGDARAEGLGVAGVVEHLGRVQKGFGGHATAQDAQAAEFAGA